jgi:hypothetical protein
VYIESDVNAKSDDFWMYFYYYGTTFSAKSVYMRESGKIGSMNKLKTPVQRCQFLDKQRGKNGPAKKRFRKY